MLNLVNVNVSELADKLKVLEAPYSEGDSTAFSVKLPDGTLINTVQLTIPAVGAARDFMAERDWKTPFKTLTSLSYSVHNVVGGQGHIGALGALSRTGLKTSNSSLTKGLVNGYTYNESIEIPVTIYLTAMGTWK